MHTHKHPTWLRANLPSSSFPHQSNTSQGAETEWRIQCDGDRREMKEPLPGAFSSSLERCGLPGHSELPSHLLPHTQPAWTGTDHSLSAGEGFVLKDVFCPERTRVYGVVGDRSQSPATLTSMATVLADPKDRGWAVGILPPSAHLAGEGTGVTEELPLA